MKQDNANEKTYWVYWKMPDGNNTLNGKVTVRALNETIARKTALTEYPFANPFGYRPRITMVLAEDELGETIDPSVASRSPEPDPISADLVYDTDRAAIRRSKRAPKGEVSKSVRATFKTGLQGFRVYETIRRPIYGMLNGSYHVLRNEEPVGKAEVVDGVINTFSIKEESDESFRGEVLFTLLNIIVQEADRINANLSVELTEENENQFKPVFERFGFQRTSGTIMKRTSGSIRPPSVIAPSSLTAGVD